METTKAKIDELLAVLKREEDEDSPKRKILCILGFIAAIAVVCLIAVLVYRHFRPKYQVESDDDFDDDFDDYFEEDDDIDE